MEPLLTSFKLIVNGDHTKWDSFVPFAAFAMNTAKESSTSVTSFQLVYGWLSVLLVESVLAARTRTEMCTVGAMRLGQVRGFCHMTVHIENLSSATSYCGT